MPSGIQYHANTFFWIPIIGHTTMVSEPHNHFDMVYNSYPSPFMVLNITIFYNDSNTSTYDVTTWEKGPFGLLPLLHLNMINNVFRDFDT